MCKSFYSQVLWYSALAILKYENKKKRFECIKIKLNEYKKAIQSSHGYVTKIKEVLRRDEDPKLCLDQIDYDEILRIRPSTPINEISARDLPSPTMNITFQQSQKLAEIMPKTDTSIKSSPRLIQVESAKRI